jgi:nucleoside phosphorylase
MLGRENPGAAGGIVDHTGRWGTARVGAVTILQVEFDAAREALRAEHQVPRSGYYTNDLGTHELVLARAHSRGNVASALTTSHLIEYFRPEVILVIGIAGGIVGREGVAPGDIVVPDYLHYADFRSLREDGDQPRHTPYDPPAVSLHGTCVFPAENDDPWRDEIRVRPPEDRGPPRVIVGPLIAAEKVYGDPTHEEQRRLVKEREYSDAIAVDMESMGVARAVHGARQSVSYNPRLLVVRGISDPVFARDDQEGSGDDRDAGAVREAWRPYAAHVAAVFASAVVKRILAFADQRSDVRGPGLIDGSGEVG